MENRTTPPPIPDKEKQPKNFGVKLILIGLIAGLLMISALITYFIIDSRESYNYTFSEEVAETWGNAVFLEGPFISNGNDNKNDIVIVPEYLNCDIDVKSQTLHRNRFDSDVFNANVKIDAKFSKAEIVQNTDSSYKILLKIDGRIPKNAEFKLNDKLLNWKVSSVGLYYDINIAELPDTISLTTELNLRGSEKIEVMKIGKDSHIRISGTAHNPSFLGNLLPDERHVEGEQFTAIWGSEFNDTNQDVCGAKFLVGLDNYQKVSRSVKYAVIIIILTFAGVFATEIMTKQQIPLLNYLLIGIAIILFYFLLLSFSEYIYFSLSYLIASVMTIGLISTYMWKMVESKKAGILMGTLLIAIYSVCYLILNLENIAMLIGSLVLFISLAIMMYVSLRISRN